jgi:hypothetical protein
MRYFTKKPIQMLLGENRAAFLERLRQLPCLFGAGAWSRARAGWAGWMNHP